MLKDNRNRLKYNKNNLNKQIQIMYIKELRIIIKLISIQIVTYISIILIMFVKNKQNKIKMFSKK
jgi:hypothetical protein